MTIRVVAQCDQCKTDVKIPITLPNIATDSGGAIKLFTIDINGPREMVLNKERRPKEFATCSAFTLVFCGQVCQLTYIKETQVAKRVVGIADL